MAQDIEIRIANLVLDDENPRVSSETGQLNIRQAILDDQGSKIFELASDIVQFGLNPMDRMMILQPDKKKKQYIALEGNRRTAALQILRKPELLNDLHLPDSLRSKLVDLAEDFDPKTVEPIKAVLMPDRESSHRWIELRHTGENSGRGIVDWNGVQTARFRGDKTLALLDFVSAHGNLTESQMTAIKGSFPITTLDRLISNPTVRQRLGLQIVDGEIQTVYAGEKILEILKRIVLDLAEKRINVTAVKSSAQQIDYVNKIPKAVFPKGPKLKTAVDLSKSITPSPTPPPPPPPPSPPPPSPLARKTLIPQGLSLQIKNQKAAQILYELRTLNLERYPVGGAMLLRSLIEAGVEIYHESNSLGKFHTAGKNKGKALNLSEKVDQTLKHLPSSKASKQVIKAANDSLLNPNSVISIRRLHEYTHNPSAFPSKSDLISSWSSIEGYLIAVFK